jgi:prepilin-type N-terminal cleavage/methylation domain-containing protein
MERNNKGFTLIELLVALALGSFLLAGSISLFTYSNRAYVVQDEVVTTQQFVRSALEILVHEIRMAGYVPPDAKENLGIYEQLSEATATAMTFIADLNADGIPERVRYTLVDTILTRESWQWDDSTNPGQWVTQTGGEAVTLAENITALGFNYTYADGTQGIPASGQDRENVRAVSITVTGRTAHQDPNFEAAGDGTRYRYRTLMSYVKLRNMGL